MGSIALDVAIREGTAHAGATQHLLFAIASYADPDGTHARVSMATLIEVTGLARRTVQYALQRLVESGELRVATGRGRGRLSEYAIDLALLRERARLRRAEKKAHAAAEKGPHRDASRWDPEKVQTAHQMHPSAAETAHQLHPFAANGAPHAPFAAEKAHRVPPAAAEKAHPTHEKGAPGAPNRVRSDRVTGDDGTGKDRPAGRPGARARAAAAAIASSLEERLGIGRDEGLLAELLEEFPELDAAALRGEIVAAATKRVRGKPWTLGDWRGWLLARPRRKEAANGTHAACGSALAGIGRRSDRLGC